jgi:hypothetical protein
MSSNKAGPRDARMAVREFLPAQRAAPIATSFDDQPRAATVDDADDGFTRYVNPPDSTA